MNGMDGQNKPTEENNMRQNRILNYIGAASLLLAVCACGKEDLNTTTDTGNGGTVAALPEGTFVVDYSVSDGEISRADQDRLNTSISSLLYLLYDSEGMLVKEREIPGIGTDTKWPLTRENMSWEQREALKDTLNVEMTYTAVFLANTDAELFKDASGKAEQVFFYKTVTEGADGTSETRYDNLKDVYLKLPSVPFNDKNMFYISKHTLSAKEAEGTVVNDRETPYNCPVTLKRLVSRMDMERVAITDETADDAVKAGIGTNFDNLLVNGLEKAFGDKVNELKSKPNVTEDNCTHLLALLESKIGGKDIDNTINNYDSFISNLVDQFKQFKQVNNYSLLVSPWTAFTTSEFTLGRMHNRMSINDLTSSYDSNITSPTSYTYPVTNGKATWIGFACNEAAKMPFTGIKLSDSKSTGDNIETIELNLSFTQEDIFLQKNGLVTYTCNPIGKIEPKELSSGGTYSGYFDVEIDMATTYGSLDNLLTADNRFSFDETNTIYAFKDAINNVFGDWNSVNLSIKIPTSEEFTYTTTIEPKNP